MKFFSKAKDGGLKSTVTGYWLCEIKSLFSVVLLKFADGSRDEYHDHAFNSLNWILSGKVIEQCIDLSGHEYTPSIKPIFTPRQRSHRVVSKGTTWVFSVRGPWSKYWHEYNSDTGRITKLTHGRKIV